MTGFAYTAPVRYLEADQQGVVFNAWYLVYLDEAMGAYLGERGLPYPELVATGVDLQLVHTELDWTGSLRYGDTASVQVATEALGTTSLTLGFDVRAGSVSVCRARSVYVCIATDGSGKRPLPGALRAALSG